MLSVMNYCRKAHAGQRRRSGEPFFTHPMTVFHMIPKENKVERILALLHDVPEDCGVTPREVCETLGLPDTVRIALEALTHQPKEEYFTYIKRCKENEYARKVKRFDLMHNIKTAKPHTKEKYSLALTYLDR
jgi:(p)ppGpp synthase/HD superfamily hydrolase